MKVLKDNYSKMNINDDIKTIQPYPRKLICEVCGSELEYEESDLRIGALGGVYLDCPLCQNDNMIDSHENELTLNADNIEFPTHFFHTSKENGAVDCCNNETIKREIRRGIDFLRKNRQNFSWMTEHGNLHIDITRFDGGEEYTVFVSNDYYSTYIPFEPKDY